MLLRGKREDRLGRGRDRKSKKIRVEIRDRQLRIRRGQEADNKGMRAR